MAVKALLIFSAVMALGLGLGVQCLLSLNDSADMSDWGAPPPWPVFRAVLWLRDILIRLSDMMVPPPIRLMEIAQGAWKERLLYLAERFKFADIIGDKALGAAEIAKAAGAHEEQVYRTLRALTTFGVFVEVEPFIFRNNRVSSALRRDHPNSMRAMVSMIGSLSHRVWDEAEFVVRTGQPGDVKAFGKPWFPYLDDHPEDEKVFSEAMTAVDGLGRDTLVVDFDWSQFKRVLDIAGSRGSVLAAILAGHKGLTGLLYDRPPVIEIAKPIWASTYAALQSRVEFAAGDFFVSVPEAKDGDCYFLRTVIHDWNDTDSIKILSTIRKAIGSRQATLVLIEPTLSDKVTSLEHANAMMDAQMMAILGLAKERTVTQYRSILSASGFEFVGRTPSRSLMQFVVAKPVATKP
eukprot:gnl/Hemi2/19631_TR6515_c0_g1_i1.p1 gnl/Hemi2/19631_TR6515_c0_g1~~gnl/Hemi2/19631_TR6515_c0_g1_i1.p1  ORF type:complete len:453 (+),score=159.97 gnl/Hemi2/19631_TR6515_c0_g1_i1:141-1361(+)